jgi:hypothetical protein
MKSPKVKLKSVEALNTEGKGKKFLQAVVISQARNPQWVFAKIDNLDGKYAVAIPRKLSGKLEGKRINVEAITDDTGTTYRHEFLST